jgi:hypothetical protein
VSIIIHPGNTVNSKTITNVRELLPTRNKGLLNGNNNDTACYSYAR